MVELLGYSAAGVFEAMLGDQGGDGAREFGVDGCISVELGVAGESRSWEGDTVMPAGSRHGL